MAFLNQVGRDFFVLVQILLITNFFTRAETLSESLSGKSVNLIFSFDDSKKWRDQGESFVKIIQDIAGDGNTVLVSWVSTKSALKNALDVAIKNKITDEIVIISDEYEKIFKEGSKFPQNSVNSVILLNPKSINNTFANFRFIKHKIYNFYSSQYLKIKPFWDKMQKAFKVVNIKGSTLIENNYFPTIGLLEEIFLAINFIDQQYKMHPYLACIFDRQVDEGKTYVARRPKIFINSSIEFDVGSKELLVSWNELISTENVLLYPDLDSVLSIFDRQIYKIKIQNDVEKIVEGVEEIFSDLNKALNKILSKILRNYLGIKKVGSGNKSELGKESSILAITIKRISSAMPLNWVEKKINDILRRFVVKKAKDLLSVTEVKSFVPDSVWVLLNIQGKSSIVLEMQKNMREAILGARLGVYKTANAEVFKLLQDEELLMFLSVYFACKDGKISKDIFLIDKDKSELLSQEYKKLLIPTSDDVLKIRRSKRLQDVCEQEASIIKKRKKEIIAEQIDEIMKLKLGSKLFPKFKLELDKIKKTNISVPNIGIVCSGGGYRATIATLGFFQGIIESGIWNTISYISTLSGSTWMVFPFYAHLSVGHFLTESGDIYKEFDKVVQVYSENLNYFSKPLESEEIENITSLLFINEHVTVADIYGSLLARALLRGLPNSGQMASLSQISKKLDLSKYPLPIATAISQISEKGTKGHQYYWFEFSPVEVGSDALRAWIPPKFLGSRFSKGEITKYCSEPTLGALMGIWGSAYAVNIKDIIDMNSISIMKYMPTRLKSVVQSSINPLINKVASFFAADKIMKFKKTEDIPYFRISPGKMFNFAYNLDGIDPKFYSEESLALYDAGIDFNLPFPPLMRRDVNLYLVCDATDYWDLSDHSLILAEKYAKKMGYPFPNFKNTSISQKKPCIFWGKEDYDYETPIVVYFPLSVKAPSFKFIYDKNEFEKISKSMMGQVLASVNLIREAICLSAFNKVLASCKQKMRLLREQENALIGKKNLIGKEQYSKSMSVIRKQMQPYEHLANLQYRQKMKILDMINK